MFVKDKSIAHVSNVSVDEYKMRYQYILVAEVVRFLCSQVGAHEQSLEAYLSLLDQLLPANAADPVLCWFQPIRLRLSDEPHEPNLYF